MDDGSSSTETTEPHASAAAARAQGTAGPTSGAAALFDGPGEVRALARTLDWGATTVGWPDSWLPALRIATRAMLDATNPVCLWVGPEYALVYNDAYRQFLAAKHPASLGQRGAVVWAEHWEVLAAQFDQVSRGGPPAFSEDARFVIERLEGGVSEVAWFNYALHPLRDEEGRIVAILNIATETTDRVLAEQALETERGRLRSVVLQAPVPMAMHEGPEHRYVLVNDAYKRVSGGRDVTGLTLREAFPEVIDQGIPELFDHVYTTGEPWTGPETHLHYDRLGQGPEDAWFDLRYDPVTDPDGRITGILNFSVDVTDHVRARREVERLLAVAEHAGREAAAANQAKSEFLATMSHELRTPVNAVLGYAQLLDVGIGGPLTDQQRGYVDRLTRSGHHLLSLVNDVLDLSKIEAGETPVAFDDAMTGPSVAAAFEVVGPAAAARNLGLILTPTNATGVPFVGDEDRVRQIVLNLLSNAVKFTAPGGTVTVTCGTVHEAPPTAFNLRGEGPWAFVRVVDTGVGIAPEEQGRIFEPFHQVEGGPTRTAGGTGLGLTISRRFARLMGGELSVASTPGTGSTFTLWLPAARAQTKASARETGAERAERAARDLTQLDMPGLGEVGVLLHDVVTEVMDAYTDRLRADPAIPRGAGMTRIQLEDHAISFLADLAQSLVIVGDAGAEAVGLLKDGSAIQHAISEAHGARRFAQGWDESALRRDQTVFREEVERAVRAHLKPETGAVDDAVHVLLELIERGQRIAVRSWRREKQLAS